MSAKIQEREASLLELVALRVRQSTHGRIRNLVVEESQGRVVISGRVSTRYAKQLALHGVLELLSGEKLREKITVD
jgi:hypothetical protein